MTTGVRVRKAIFPAAGLGTRFLPVTKAQPKEMLPLVDKPTIQYGVEEAIATETKGVRRKLDVTIGTMIETPRAAIRAEFPWTPSSSTMGTSSAWSKVLRTWNVWPGSAEFRLRDSLRGIGDFEPRTTAAI